MDTEQRFRRVFLAFLLPFLAIRIIARIIPGMRQPKRHQVQEDIASTPEQRWKELTTHEARLSVAARIVFGPLMLVFGLLYFLAPGRVQRWIVPLSAWLRWIGAGLGFASLPLLAWTHQSLGRAWSTNLELQEQHVLVTSGPYHWIRHPMYTAVLAFFVGSALVSANGIIIMPAAMGLWVMLARMDDEEAMMIAQFGDDYRTYMTRTGRFVPKLPL